MRCEVNEQFPIAIEEEGTVMDYVDHEFVFVNIVKGRKIVQLSNAMSLKIADCLKQQKDVPYREEEFICNLEGLQAAWEPFELQPMAIANETFK